MSRIWRDPGVTVSWTSGGSVRPRSTAATTARSSYDELTDEPTQTWAVRVPATSRTGTTFPGELGSAISGSSAARSITSTRSYSAPTSGPSSIQSPPRPCASSHSRTRPSLGKTPVVAPVSTTMLQIVARSVADSVATPSPKNSKIAPTPPRTPKRRSSSRITSFASTQSESAPSRRTPTISGAAVTNGCPAIATATSSPPAPIASEPTAPAAVVWESAPRSSAPGRENRSRCT